MKIESVDAIAVRPEIRVVSTNCNPLRPDKAASLKDWNHPSLSGSFLSLCLLLREGLPIEIDKGDECSRGHSGSAGH